MPQAITRNLYLREGTSDKVYNVILEPRDAGWVVSIQRGRRGSNLIEDTKTPYGPVDYRTAYNIFTQTVLSKTRKRYLDNPDADPAFNNRVQHEKIDRKAKSREQDIDEGYVLRLDDEDSLFKM